MILKSKILKPKLKSTKSHEKALTDRLTWSTICEFFSGEWVELTDIAWEWGTAHPTVARVRCHASDRGLLVSKISQSTPLKETTILYVGSIKGLVNLDELKLAV